jgi:TPR repeat protein
MKWTRCAAKPLVIFALWFAGCRTPAKKASAGESTSTVPESWESISNRWCSVPVETVKHAAKHGDVTGEFYLGWLLWSGHGIATNRTEAIRWFQTAAEKGLAAAQNRIGWLYHHGEGLKTNYDEALKWYRKAAQQGYASSDYNLGTMYYSGAGTPKDHAEALMHFRRAAGQGLAPAQASLGYMYREGLGTPKDDNQSVLWYRKAADQGVAEAQRSLGYAFQTGRGVVQDYREAARLYRLAADQGDAMAQNNLGWLYRQGRGVPRDPVEAVKWLQQAADQGEPHAASNLAWIYADGVYGPGNVVGYGAEAYIRSGGVAPNHELAEKWMRKAVDLNSPEGQYQMGSLLSSVFYSGGQKETTILSAAGEFFRKSAEQGHDKAQYELAEMYLRRQLGEPTNCIPWFLKAAAQGNVKAQAEVGNLPRYFPNNEMLKSIDVVAALRQGADSGNLDAQYQLAKRYQSGDGVPKDAGEAFRWMQKASEHDQPSSTIVSDALYELGLMYENGQGVPADLSEARAFFLQAAAGYQPDASFRVGQMFEKGEGVQQDDYEASKCYYYAILSMGGRKSKFDAVESLLRLYSTGRGLSKTGHEAEDFVDRELANKAKFLKYIEGMIVTPKAKLYAGDLYYRGKVVPQDLVEAAAWLDLAAKGSTLDARKLFDQIELEMSPAQKDEAERRAGELNQQLRFAH